ncbi:MAG: ATPase, partial [Deltaproteobacteria bacterium]
MEATVTDITEKVKGKSSFVARLREEVGKVIVGQRFMIDRLLVGLLADGHILV